MNGVPTEPLFAIPALSAISLTTMFFWVWLALCAAFLIHWVVASYHWYTFGSERSVSILSISVYGIGGALLLSAAGLTLLAM